MRLTRCPNRRGRPRASLNYERAYGAQYCATCLYTLGNGVPTDDGQSPAVPWQYGLAGYVPEAYPMARSAMIRLRYRL